MPWYAQHATCLDTTDKVKVCVTNMDSGHPYLGNRNWCCYTRLDAHLCLLQGNHQENTFEEPVGWWKQDMYTLVRSLFVGCE